MEDRTVVRVDVQVLISEDEGLDCFASSLELLGIDVVLRGVLKPSVNVLLVHEQGLGSGDGAGIQRQS